MKKIALLILALCFLFPLHGCGDSNIDLVKDGTLSFDTSTTIGNVFDSYPYFESGEWSSFEDQQKRVIVQFEGELNSDAVFQNTRSGFLLDRLQLGRIFDQCLQNKTCASLMEDKAYLKVYLTVQFTILGDERFEVSYIGTRLDNGKEASCNGDMSFTALYAGKFNHQFSNLLYPQVYKEVLSISDGSSDEYSDFYPGSKIKGTWAVVDAEERKYAPPLT